MESSGAKDEREACDATFGVRGRVRRERETLIMPKIPYVGFSNATLARCPPIQEGDEITCPGCQQKHRVTKHGAPPTELYFFQCGDASNIAGINGKNVIGVKVDVSGEIPPEELPS